MRPPALQVCHGNLATQTLPDVTIGLKIAVPVGGGGGP